MAQRSEGNIDLQTLALTAVSSATAAYVTSKVWAPGTLASAAMTPVIIALLKEALSRPGEVITSVVPDVRGRVRARRTETVPHDLPDRYEQGAPPPLPPPVAGAEEGPVRVYSTRGRRLRWRLAVLTGLLGFATCVVAFTVPELIAGGSARGGGHKTTFFGGERRSAARTTSTTSTTPSTTPTTTTPAQTTTAPAQTVTTPAQTPDQTPTTTTPAPGGGTAAPTEPAPSPQTPAPATPPAQTTP
jgi:hypothetical protein